MKPPAIALRILLTITLWACSALGQNNPTELPTDLPSALPAVIPEGAVVSVRTEPALYAESPLTLTGLSIGESFTRERARAALRSALDSGSFAEARISARPVAGGVEVTVRGERSYLLRSVSLLGVRARSLDEVSRELTLMADTRVTDSDVSEATRRIERSYRDIGWNEARVESVWRETDEPAERVLMLRVTEGEATRVDSVTLDDVPEALRPAVRSELGLREGDVADPGRLRQAAERVLPVLRRAGYLGASGLSIELLPSGERRRSLRVTLSRGDVYVVRFEGVTRVTDRELLNTLRLDEERDIDSPTLSVLAGRARTFYVRRAFPDARVHVEVRAIAPGRRAVVFSVTEGPQVFVGSLRFPGARHFSEVSLADDVRGLLVSELPGGTAFAAPDTAVDELLNGEDRSNLPNSRPDPMLRLSPERTYVPQVYTEAARRIALRYREQGFLDTEVAAHQVTRTRDPDGVTRLGVTFNITEGPRTFLDELVFEGNRELPSASLAQAAAITLGVPIDYRAIEEARVRVTDLYRERAYAFVRVEPEVLRSPDRSRARLRFSIHEGPRVRVGAVRIDGAGRTGNALVRQRLALHEDGYYLLSAVRTSQRRIDQLGVFSGVNITLDDPDIEAPVKTVVVRLTERRRQAFEARFGYSLGQGARVGFEYGYLNLFGAAVSLTLRSEIGYFIEIPGLTPSFGGPEQPKGIHLLQFRITPSLGFPYVPLLGPDASASFDLAAESRLITDSRNFTLRIVTGGGSFSIVNRAIRNLTLTLTTEVQYANAKLYGTDSIQDGIRTQEGNCARLVEGTERDQCRLRLANLQQLLRYPDGDNVLGAVRLGAAYDRRNSQFNPTNGTYTSLTTEVLTFLHRDAALTGPSPTTLHLEGRAAAYLQLPVLRMVFASSLRAGWNIQLVSGGETHPLRKFFLGGADSMRGWLQNSMIPADNAQGGGSTFGGDFYVTFRNELRIPTGLCFADSLCLGLAVFLDTGNLWRQPENVNLAQLRFSPGFGARFNTPFGAISFDFGFPIKPRADLGESSFALQFSLGAF